MFAYLDWPLKCIAQVCHTSAELLVDVAVCCTADLIDGIRIGAAAAEETSSPTADDVECSEDSQATTEPTVNDGSPASDNCGTDVFDDNVPKYSDDQLDAVRKYD